MTEQEFINSKRDTIHKFSAEFIEKYKYCPTTSAVINCLIRGMDSIRLLEDVLQRFEDLNKEYEKIQIDCITMTGKPYQFRNDQG